MRERAIALMLARMAMRRALVGEDAYRPIRKPRR